MQSAVAFIRGKSCCSQTQGSLDAESSLPVAEAQTIYKDAQTLWGGMSKTFDSFNLTDYRHF